LNGVTFGAIARTQRWIEIANLGAGLPMIVQGLCRRRCLIFVEHVFETPNDWTDVGNHSRANERKTSAG
jgi:hypothetical protein